MNPWTGKFYSVEEKIVSAEEASRKPRNSNIEPAVNSSQKLPNQSALLNSAASSKAVPPQNSNRQLPPSAFLPVATNFSAQSAMQLPSSQQSMIRAKSMEPRQFAEVVQHAPQVYVH